MIDAVRTLSDPDSPGFAAAVRELIHADDPEVDRLVMDVYKQADNDAVGAQASRVLALRDPDRDPEYALARFRTTGSVLTKPFRRVVENAVYRFPLTNAYGISRLTRAEPLVHYRAGLSARFGVNRMRSLMALGDVPDPVAVPLILGGADDRTWGVRANVPIALRRYRMAFGEAVVRDSDALPVLHRLLLDGHRKVAAQSALALRVFGDLDPVREAVDGRPWIAEALTGEIRPLPAFGAGEPDEALP